MGFRSLQYLRLQLVQPFQESLQFLSLSVGEFLTWLVYEFPVSERSWRKLRPDPVSHGMIGTNPLSAEIMDEFGASCAQSRVFSTLFPTQIAGAGSRIENIHSFFASNVFLGFFIRPMQLNPEFSNRVRLSRCETIIPLTVMT